MVSKAIIDKVLKSKGKKKKWGEDWTQAVCAIGKRTTNWATASWIKVHARTRLINSWLRNYKIKLFITKNYRIQWQKHVERLDPDRMPKQILSYAPRGCRSLGRPQKRWKETVTDPLGSNTRLHMMMMTKNCWVLTPNILDRKSGEGALSYCKTGAELDSYNRRHSLVWQLMLLIRKGVL
jgi:hypothetical protein